MHEMTNTEASATPVARTSWSQGGDHQHGVQFYSQDEFLLDELTEYIGTALRAADAAVVVATEPHRQDLLQRLTTQGLEVSAIAEQGRFVVLDAATTLETVAPNGTPDRDQFNVVIGGVLNKALASATSPQPRVAVFGEMVALLWAAGRVESAIRLEQLWNELARTVGFSLFCAYPINSFQREQDAELFLQLCREHSTVIPTEGYVTLATEDARLRSVTELQQKAKALENEVAQHQRLRQELELHVQTRRRNCRARIFNCSRK